MTVSSRTIYIFIVTSYAIVLVPFVDSALRNYLALFAALLGGIAILAFKIRFTFQFFLAIVLFYIMAISILITSDASDLVTVALTGVYAAGYFAVSGILDGLSNRRSLTIKLLRNIIFAFAVVSAIQMIASLSNLPVPNVIGSKGLWSYPSLTMEPSHLGRVAGITMLSYLILSWHGVTRTSIGSFLLKHRNVIFAFLTTMLLSGSSLAFFAMIMVLIMWRSIPVALATISLVLLAIPFLSTIGIEAIQRSLQFFKVAITSFDIEGLYAADSSGAVRIIPTILFIQDASFGDPAFWFGGGKSALVHLVSGRIPGVPEDLIMAGFMPGYLAIYGVITAAIFVWIFVINPLNRKNAAIAIFWLIFFTSAAWNTQTFWYGLMMIQVVRHSLDDDRKQLKRPAR